MDSGVEATLAELGISSLDNVVNINFTELKVILSALLSKLGTQSKSIANMSVQLMQLSQNQAVLIQEYNANEESRAAGGQPGVMTAEAAAAAKEAADRDGGRPPSRPSSRDGRTLKRSESVTSIRSTGSDTQVDVVTEAVGGDGGESAGEAKKAVALPLAQPPKAPRTLRPVSRGNSSRGGSPAPSQLIATPSLGALPSEILERLEKVESRLATLQLRIPQDPSDRLSYLEDKLALLNQKEISNDEDQEKEIRQLQTELASLAEQTKAAVAALEAERVTSKEDTQAISVVQQTVNNRDADFLRLQDELRDLKDEMRDTMARAPQASEIRVEGGSTADFDTLEKYTKRFCSLLDKDVKANKRAIEELSRRVDDLASEVGAQRDSLDLRIDSTAAHAEKAVNELRRELEALESKMDSGFEHIGSVGGGDAPPASASAGNTSSRAAAAPDAAAFPVLAIDRDGKVTEWTPEAAVLTGVRRDDAVGQSFLDQMLDSACAPEARTQIGSAMLGNRTPTFHYVVKGTGRNQGKVPLLLEAVPVRDGSKHIAGVRFVTPAKGAKRLLMTVSPSGKISSWTKDAMDLSGLTRDAALQKAIGTALLDPRDNELGNRAIARATLGVPSVNVAVPLLTADGVPRVVPLSFAPQYDRTGKITGASIFADAADVAARPTEAALFHVDKKLNVREWMPRSTSLTGVRETDVLGSPLKNIVGDMDADDAPIRMAVEAALAGKTVPDVAVAVQSDRMPRPVRMLATVRPRHAADGQVVGCAFTMPTVCDDASRALRWEMEDLERGLGKELKDGLGECATKAELRAATEGAGLGPDTISDLRDAIAELQAGGGGGGDGDGDGAAHGERLGDLARQLAELRERVDGHVRPAGSGDDFGASLGGDADALKVSIQSLEGRIRDTEEMLDRKGDRTLVEGMRRSIDDLLASVHNLKLKVNEELAKEGGTANIEANILGKMDQMLVPLRNKQDEHAATMSHLSEDKASWQAVESLLEEKADLSDLATKANRSYCEALFNRMNSLLSTELAKLGNMNQDQTQNVEADIKRIQEYLATTASRDDVELLSTQLMEGQKRVDEDTAALTTKPLLQNYRCLSCDTFLPVLSQKNTPSIPNTSLPVTVGLDSMGPRLAHDRHLYGQNPRVAPPNDKPRLTSRGRPPPEVLRYTFRDGEQTQSRPKTTAGRMLPAPQPPSEPKE